MKGVAVSTAETIAGGLAGRGFASVDDFSNQELAYVLALAAEVAEHRDSFADACRGKIMASLFFEASTRTRLSFETAMLRLGGQLVSAVDIGATSLAKGETLADMARVLGGYTDLIVMRHPWEGAARVMAEYAGVPVINAGDGGHEHPTQTLCDLYTLQRDRGRLQGLRIALWGDLKYGRTVHSLAWALARFGATIVFRPGAGFAAPEHVLSKLATDYGGELVRGDVLSQTEGEGVLPVDALYMTPHSPHQLAMLPHLSAQLELDQGVDALYVTRLQKERLQAQKGELRPEDYPVVDRKLLRKKGFERSVVLHPLPRVDELSLDIDSDPRSLYFKQAHQGVPVRMALISLLLGCSPRVVQPAEWFGEDWRPVAHPRYTHDTGIHCPNERCVANQPSEMRYLPQKFFLIAAQPPRLRCAYCDHEIHPPVIATAEAYDESTIRRKYHPAGSRWTATIRPENLLLFASTEDAEAAGFHRGAA
jgi:aspartate carbamoyltransferase catalytic subunit